MMTLSRREFFFLLSLFSTAASNCGVCSAAGPSISNAIQGISRRGLSTLARSIPALSVYNVREGSNAHKTMEVAVKRKKKQKRNLNLPHLKLPEVKLPEVDVFSHAKKVGVYYGISSDTISKAKGPKRLSLSDSMYETLEELKLLRLEMERMRKEMHTLKRKMVADGDLEEDSEESRAKSIQAKSKSRREYEKLAVEIEKWAKVQLKETEEDGWREVPCNKMMKKSLNPMDKTKAYIKWMKDSRGDNGDPNDNTEYPCIKCVSIIDAPLEDVCTYLSQESAFPEYNDLVVKYKDVEDITPSAKICWSQTPQILFLKSRDFVTFCHHRWKRDGTEVILNQACEHPDFPGAKEESEKKACRAYALRGANFLSRCPDDPEKTRIVIIAHANPGGGVPQWAMKTAVNALAPIEPFKLFHKIDANVQQHQTQLRQRLQEAEMVSTLPNGRSPRPAGIAQLGYACFWPEGGGVKEGGYQQPSDTGNNEGQSNSEQVDNGEQREPAGGAADSPEQNDYVESS